MHSSSRRQLRGVLAFTLFLTSSYALYAQDADAPKTPAATDTKKPATTPAKDATKDKPKNALKVYADVITKEAKSDSGVFTVHRIGDKVYFEIPAAQLGQPFLWVTEIAQLPAGRGYGGTAIDNRVLRWTRRENKIYLRDVSYAIRADEKLAVYQAVTSASLEPIIMAFDVETEGKNKAAVIDVTKLYTSDPPEFSVKQALSGSGVDTSRSYIDNVKAFPTNIETRSLLTFSSSSGGSISALIHYSMVALPKTPMMGRLADTRIGYFTEDFEDYGRDEHRVVDRSYITRFRLEKKEPFAKLSEPITPIVFYLGREIPEKWRPYMKKAVEAWNPAFEEAGFKNAIMAKDAPTVAQDPNWDPEDARYNVIRWAPTTFENAMGPSVPDPRSGEVLESHVIIWHNVLKLAESWYFVQASPSDPRAQKLPLPDDLMGDIVQYIVTHEIGHTLGLEHNFKASSAYSIAQLRDPKFTAQYGDEASIMDYGRFNYVAQPGDGARLIPVIGPYDKFAIAWGYTPIPSAKTPDDEKPALNKMAERQILEPNLRFGNSHYEDPTQQTEDLGDDPIEATRLGLKNLARVADLLIPATTKPGEDYDLLAEMYQQLYSQRLGELAHVAALIGGVENTDWHVGYGTSNFRPVPKARQAQALAFLLQYGFTPPRELTNANVIYRIQSSGVADTVASSQTYLLGTLLDEQRVKRLIDGELLAPGNAYTVSQLVTDLQNGIWSELLAPQPKISIYRRNLQRSYLQIMKNKTSGDFASRSDFRPIGQGALRDLSKRITLALPRTKDQETRLHLMECASNIQRILNPKS